MDPAKGGWGGQPDAGCAEAAGSNDDGHGGGEAGGGHGSSSGMGGYRGKREGKRSQSGEMDTDAKSCHAKGVNSDLNKEFVSHARLCVALYYWQDNLSLNPRGIMATQICHESDIRRRLARG